MSYTLLQVSDFDPAEIARIDLTGITSHDVAVKQIQLHSKGWSWTYERVFTDLGVVCQTVIPAIEVVRRLALSTGEAMAGSSSGLTYLNHAIREAKPAVLFLENPALLDQQAISLLRNRPARPLLVTHFCAALRPAAEATLAAYDLVLCCSPHFVALAKARGARAQLHYHAAPPAALELPVPPLERRKRRACFIGSIVPGSRYHSQRLQLLRQICSAGVPIDIYSEAPSSRLLAALGSRMGSHSRLVRSLSGIERRVVAGSPLQKALQPPVYGHAMLQTLQHYICAVNVHAGVAQGYAANMRLFEAAALGVCLITEDQPNLSDLFEPGREILTYRSVEELIAHIRFCIAQPQKAGVIGNRARQRALSNHRYADRVGSLHNLLLRLLDQRP